MIVTYKRKYPIGSFLNEDIGFEYEIPDLGNPIEAIQMLKEMADKAHELLNPGLSVQVDYSAIPGHPMSTPEIPIIPKTNEQKKEKQISNFIEAINTSTSLKAVEIFRKMVERENNPELTATFENKLKQLSK